MISKLFHVIPHAPDLKSTNEISPETERPELRKKASACFQKRTTKVTITIARRVYVKMNTGGRLQYNGTNLYVIYQSIGVERVLKETQRK